MCVCVHLAKVGTNQMFYITYNEIQHTYIYKTILIINTVNYYIKTYKNKYVGIITVSYSYILYILNHV